MNGRVTPVRGGIRAIVAPGLAFLVALTLLVGLGVWQLYRLQWKLNIIHQIEARTTASPVPIPPRAAWNALKPADYAYRHVTVTGIFDHAKEVHVFRPLAPEDAHGGVSGIGDLVLTPLDLPGGGIVVVNRGFVPENRLDPATRSAGQVSGPVTITGLMREPETRNLFTPADDPTRNNWYTRDPQAIAAHWHLADVAPFTIDADRADSPGGLPQGGTTVLSIPNNHLSYALTWFGLAIGLCGVFVVFAWRRLRGAPSSPVPQAEPHNRGSQHPGAPA